MKINGFCCKKHQKWKSSQFKDDHLSDGIADGVAALNTRGFMGRAHRRWEGGSRLRLVLPWEVLEPHAGLGGGAGGPLENGRLRGPRLSLLTCKALQGKHLLSLNVNVTVSFFFFSYVKKGRKNTWSGRKD